MIVSLDNVRRSQLLLQPVRESSGGLVGLEIISPYAAAGSSDDIALFADKLNLLARSELFFIRRRLAAWISITPAAAGAMLSDPALMACARRFPGLSLLINEDFADAELLAALKQDFTLVLANFGAGDAASGFAFSGIFSAVFFDADFIRYQIARASFAPFMRALMGQMSPNFSAVMAAGVDDEFTLAQLSPWGLNAMKGDLWPAVGLDQLTQLVQE